jgi:hypothetical protein
VVAELGEHMKKGGNFVDFKIKRKLHPKYPDYIPALKLVGIQGDLVESIIYSYIQDTPVAIVAFRDSTFMSVIGKKSYKYNGNTWILMGQKDV